MCCLAVSLVSQNKLFYSVDATFSPRLGKMVNDATGKQQNAAMRQITVDGKLHLAMFAIKDVEEGEEVRYDYGVRDLPWRKKKSSIRKDSECS